MKDDLALLAWACVVGLLALLGGLRLLLVDEFERQECVRAHQVCVASTDGWLPATPQGD